MSRPTDPPERSHRRPRRRLRIAALAAGAILVAAAPTWRAGLVPRLTAFPTDLHVTTHYSGTLTLYVDPATAAPLDDPKPIALNVSREIVAVPEESSAELVVVDEIDRVLAPPLPPMELRHRYVMDRRTFANVADPRAWAYTPDNVLDRSGTWLVNLPMGVSAGGDYPMFSDDVATSSALVPDPAAATLPAAAATDLRLVGFAGHGTDPLSAGYLAALRATMALPESLTMAQMTPFLARMGLDIPKLLAALMPVATAEEVATLTSMAEATIPLRYVKSTAAQLAIEPRTGSIVHVGSMHETIGVVPDTSGLPAVIAVLDRHADVPELAEAAATLRSLGAEPIPLMGQDYAQTPASTAEVASMVRSQLWKLDLVEKGIPLGLLAAGIVLVAAVLVADVRTWWLHRHLRALAFGGPHRAAGAH